jgi:hypothetical protein
VRALAATLRYCIEGRAPTPLAMTEVWRREGGPAPIPPDMAHLLRAIDATLAGATGERPQSIAEFRRLLSGAESSESMRAITPRKPQREDRRADERGAGLDADSRGAVAAAGHRAGKEPPALVATAEPLPAHRGGAAAAAGGQAPTGVAADAQAEVACTSAAVPADAAAAGSEAAAAAEAVAEPQPEPEPEADVEIESEVQPSIEAEFEPATGPCAPAPDPLAVAAETSASPPARHGADGLPATDWLPEVASARDGSEVAPVDEARSPPLPQAVWTTDDAAPSLPARTGPRRSAARMAVVASLVLAVAATVWGYRRVDPLPFPQAPRQLELAAAAPAQVAPIDPAAAGAPKVAVATPAPPPATEPPAAGAVEVGPAAGAALPRKKAPSPPAKSPAPRPKTVTVAAKARSPQEACAGRKGFALYQCMQLQCTRSALQDDADCAALR